MARPREFEIEQALKDAMNVFWERGYEGASLPDLLDSMGIARGSLYKAFGDKKTLFLEALSRYDRDVLTPAITLLRSKTQDATPPPIKQLFSSVVQAARRGDRRGCLLCNAAAGPAAEDEEIRHVVAMMLRRAFAAALKGDCTAGAGQAADVNRQARVLTTAYVGLRVLARSGASIASLEQASAGIAG